MVGLNKFEYLPPSYETEWNSLATRLAGRLVTEYRGFVNSGQELYERFAEEIAQEWVTMDDDPDPKYSWETVWREIGRAHV